MKRICLLLSIILAHCAFSHEYFVSITDLEYDATENRIKGTIKMTAHDFEHVLEDKFERKIELENVKDNSEEGKYIQAYLAEHLKVYSEDKLLLPKYLGKEVTVQQDLFFYFSLHEITNPRAIKVHNNLLFELFSAQQNIVHYKYKDQTKSVTLVASKPVKKIIFD